MLIHKRMVIYLNQCRAKNSKIQVANGEKAMKNNLNKLIIGAMSSIAFINADASIVGGTVTEISPPPAVFNDSYLTDALVGYDEKQGYTLASGLSVDLLASTSSPGMVSAGTTLDSHYFFLDPVSFLIEDSWTIVFDKPVLAIITSTDLVFASDYLGAAGTIYPGPFEKRGLENCDVCVDEVTLLDAYTLQVSLHVTEPGDWFRVVTAASPVPVPAAAWLFGSGLLGLVAVARRK